MEAFSPNLRASNDGHPDESNLDAPAQINQAPPVQSEVAKSKRTWGDTLMKILWGIGMGRTQSSVSQIAHDDTAAWERIGEECVRMNKDTLLYAMILMCSTVINVIVIHWSRPNSQPPIGLLVIRYITEVSCITNSLPVVLMAYNIFIVGERGIAEALRTGRYGRILFVCLAAEVMLLTTMAIIYIEVCVGMWIIGLPRAFSLLFTIFFISISIMIVRLAMNSIWAKYVRESPPGDRRTQTFPPTIV